MTNDLLASKHFLKKHLQISEQNRNFQWDEQFFKHFVNIDVALLSADPQQGPDGWPYLLCTMLNDAKVQTETHQVESVQKLIHWLVQKGIGLVVNPMREPYPDFVFSYGMLWSFKETGFFMRPELANNSNASGAGAVSYENNQIYSGLPTEQFLPNYVRKVLKDFFNDQSVFNPKILMISTDQKNYDLAFSLESLGHPPESEHAGIAEALSWFLPPHYSLVLISEKNLPAFSPLIG